jgi:hypothetical protein
LLNLTEAAFRFRAANSRCSDIGKLACAFGGRGASMSEASKDIPSPEEHARWLAWFDEYTARLNARPRDLPLRCPCCGCKTLSERTAFEICEVCFWEDDGQDDCDADENRGGPNGSLSLTEARANYLQFGACEEIMVANVRPPRPEELP